jgi:ribonuclease HI
MFSWAAEDPHPAAHIERFVPLNIDDSPRRLFDHGPQFIRYSNPNEALVYTDGSCLNNGQLNPQAGCGYVVGEHRGPGNARITMWVGFRLEHRGPSGIRYTQTSNRAELRAAIAALQYQQWESQFSRLGIATDSEYVVLGATERWVGWQLNGWRTRQGQPVANRDLWEALLREVQACEAHGLHILLWWIPRSWNASADRAAREGALRQEVEEYCDPLGN